MSERLLLEGREDGWALLRRDDGVRLRVPAAWLPADARAGAALDVVLSPGPDEAGITLRTVEGNDEPGEESVGA